MQTLQHVHDIRMISTSHVWTSAIFEQSSFQAGQIQVYYKTNPPLEIMVYECIICSAERALYCVHLCTLPKKYSCLWTAWNLQFLSCKYCLHYCTCIHAQPGEDGPSTTLRSLLLAHTVLGTSALMKQINVCIRMHLL